MFDSKLSDSDRASVRQRLMSKWDVPTPDRRWRWVSDGNVTPGRTQVAAISLGIRCPFLVIRWLSVRRTTTTIIEIKVEACTCLRGRRTVPGRNNKSSRLVRTRWRMIISDSQ